MPRRNHQNVLNRGRFQAQGDGLEKSRAWSNIAVPTKEVGRSFLEELKNKLEPAELRVRETCFEKALRWINSAPSDGYKAVRVIKTSFPPYPPKKGVRVDGEVHSGSAFID